MKAYKIELLIIDHEDMGLEEILDDLDNTQFTMPQVKSVEVRDIGDWSDEHPLNRNETADAEYRALFAGGKHMERDRVEEAVEALMILTDDEQLDVLHNSAEPRTQDTPSKIPKNCCTRMVWSGYQHNTDCQSKRVLAVQAGTVEIDRHKIAELIRFCLDNE